MSSLLRRSLATVSLTLACSGGGDAPTPPPVTPVTPASIALAPTTLSLVTGASGTMTASVTGSNGQPMPSATIAWSSEQPTIASVNGAGASATVTAIAPGSATIRATAGSATAVAQITVSAPVVPQAVAITPNTLSINAGATGSVTAAVTGSNGQPMPQATVTWVSDQPTIASVSGSGQQATITGVAGGTATIRATAGSVSATVAVTVVIPVARIALTGPSELLFGDTASVAGSPRDAAGNVLTGRPVTWSSSAASIVSVSSSGALRAVKRGTAYVRATSEGRTDSLRVLVYGVISLNITPESLVVRAPDTGALRADLFVDRFGLPGGVTWTSLNPTIATVVAPGTVTAVSPGTARIVLRSGLDTSLTDTAIVRVPFPCSEPRPIVFGTSIQDRFTTADCGGATDYFRYSVPTASIVQFTVSGTDSMRVWPVYDHHGVGVTLTTTQRSAYAVVTSGTHDVAVLLQDPSKLNNPYVLSSGTVTALPACASSTMVMPGTSFAGSLTTACPAMFRAGTTLGPAFTFFLRSTANQPLRVTATSNDFPVRLDVSGVGVPTTPAAIASAAGQPANLVTAPAPLTGMTYVVQISSATVGGSGVVNISILP